MNHFWEPKSKTVDTEIYVKKEPTFAHHTYSLGSKRKSVSKEEIEEQSKCISHKRLLVNAFKNLMIKRWEYESAGWLPVDYKFVREVLLSGLECITRDRSKLDELSKMDESKKDIINRSEFLREFNNIDLDLDVEESKAFIKMLREPNPKAENLRRLSEEKYGNVDMTADIIPIKIRLKRKKES